ncbi:MAG: NAD(P)/FAD-dependent oxidoreductase [Candidatus Acidiferrales bacterium]
MPLSSLDGSPNNLHGSPATRGAVAVVGGSAAGFYAAYLLARRGVPVRVFEQSEQLDAAERTLIVTRRMNDLLGAAGKASIVNEVRRFELFTDGRAATIDLAQPDLIIERAKLICSLAEHAREAGAEIRLGRNFRSLTPQSQKISLELQHTGKNTSEEFAAETVIASDGASSAVAQAAGWPRPATVPLVQAIVPLPKDMSPDTVRVWFVPNDTPYFYWLIPESSERGALGIIGESGSEAREHLDAFLVKRKLEPLAFQGARIPVYKRWVPVEKRFGAARIFVVGDAAAQVKVSTVGGIVTGLRGAVGVTEAILSPGSERELRRLRRELDMHLLIRRALHDFQQADYSSLVDSLNPPAKRSLSHFSRDEALKVLWRVCLSQPRLILMGLRGLLTGRRFDQRDS